VDFCIGQWETTCASTPDGNDTSWHLVTLVFDGSQPTPQTKLLGYLDGELQTLSYEQGGPYPTATPTYDEHWDLDAVSDVVVFGGYDDKPIGAGDFRSPLVREWVTVIGGRHARWRLVEQRQRPIAQVDELDLNVVAIMKRLAIQCAALSP
jgi:hypothetical protein